MKIKSEGDLKKISEKGNKTLLPSEVRIQVGAATCGLAKRAKALKEALESEGENCRGWLQWNVLPGTHSGRDSKR